MVGRQRRSPRHRRRKLLGNHQKCWIWGRHVVHETLSAGRWPPLELILATDLDNNERLRSARLAGRHGIPVRTETADRLTQLSGARDHQGLLARMPPYPYISVDKAVAASRERPFFLILDRIQDPFNFGAICRVACVYGADAVFIGSKSQVEVTGHVARSSAGAVNRLQICRADDLLDLARSLREHGIRLTATSPSADAPLQDADFRGPTGLIVGNEGAGVRPELMQMCDRTVRIPQATAFDSLNAAVSTGIVCYEIFRQRSIPGRAFPGDKTSRGGSGSDR